MGDAAGAGFDVQALDRLTAEIEAGEFPNTHALLIEHDGRLVFERYFPGSDQRWGEPIPERFVGPDSLHDVRSISKSVTSALLGIALGERFEDTVARPVGDYLPQVDLVAEKRAITLHHVLTMTPGLAWNEMTVPYTDTMNDEIRLYQPGDPARYVMSRPVVAEPGSTWYYSGGATQVLASVITELTGERLDDFARTHLFDPLGITDFEWLGPGEWTPDNPAAMSGLRLTARDLAKIGSVYLHGGRWRGRQVVPEAWVARSSLRHIDDTGDYGGEGVWGYGYQWWIGDLPSGPRVVSALGNGDQCLHVVPEERVVVTVFGGRYNQTPTLCLGILERVLDAQARVTPREDPETRTVDPVDDYHGQGGGDTVYVAAPTGEREADRATIQVALEQVEPGGTIAFEPGTYLVGGINLDVAVPGITLVGHPDGTTLRGCDPEVFEDYEIAMFACNALGLSGGHQTVRGLTFEYAWHGLTVGCCLPADLEQLQSWEWRPEPKRPGGDTIEDNTFRYTPNGLRVMGRSSEPTVIRGNRFMDVYHAIGINGGGVHFLDNRIRAEQPHRVPTSTHPGDAINISPAGGPGDNTTCSDNVVAGNRIEGHTHGIRISVNAPDTSCRQNVVVANRIVVERVPFVTRWFGIPVGDEADFTVAGVPLSLVNYPMLDPETDGRPQPDRTPAIEDNVIERNEIIGGYGLGIEVVHASRNRIADNAIRGIRARDPFPGNVLLDEYVGWRGANGSGLWVSPGSDGNEIVGNTFEDIADAAVVVEGDSNRVSLLSGSDAVRDLGTGNQVEGPTDRRRHPAATEPAPAHTVYDAEVFFDTEIVFPARWDRGVFSHDERRVLIGSDRTGPFNAFAFPVDGGEPEQLTYAVDGSIVPVSWFPHDDRVLYEGDEGGNERSVLRVREVDGSSTGLTAADDVRAEFLGWSADGSAFWVATDERARPVMDVYRYSSDDYDRTMIFRNDGEYLIAGISQTGRWIALQRTNSNTDTDLYIHDLEDGEIIPISPDVEGVRHRFMDFSPDGDIAYYGTDQFGEFQEVWRYQLSPGERMLVERAEWDVRRLRISPAGSYRIAQIMEDAFPAVRVTHVETGERIPFPQLPVGEAGRVAFSPTETKLLLMAQGPRSPGDLYLLDLDDPRAPLRQLTRVLNPAINPADLVEAEIVRFESYDGLEIAGILYRPRRASREQRVPAMVYLHGGPGGISTRTGTSGYSTWSTTAMRCST